MSKMIFSTGKCCKDTLKTQKMLRIITTKALYYMGWEKKHGMLCMYTHSNYI